MFNLYTKWVSWVEQRNTRINASPNRRFYGTPLLFCEFVIQELKNLLPEDHSLVELASVVRTSLAVSQQWAGVTPTTMANHRSVGMPKIKQQIGLGDHVRLSTAVATMRVTHDVTTLFDANPRSFLEPPAKETYLLWHLAEKGRIQLSQVDSLLYSTVAKLKDGSQPVAALLVDWVQDNGTTLDYDRLANVLTEARELNIVETL
jgi:hypothetical protein